MGTLNSIYIRKVDDQTLATIRQQFKSAVIEQSSDFIAVNVGNNNFDPPTEKLIHLAHTMSTEIVWLGFQSVVDAFQFQHWKGDKHHRSLVYGCYSEERTWERVEGTPDPWENAAFFDPECVKNSLECFDEEKDRAEYERVCHDKELVPGATFPWVDARETARKVAEYYRLPGWSIEGVESEVVQRLEPTTSLASPTPPSEKPWWRFW
jgi:hypothetical protein